MIPPRTAGTIHILLAICCLSSCGPRQDRSPAIGQAYVGPATLPLKQDLSTKASVTATVHHGEALDILEFKRRFIKVRTAGGIAGWTDVHELLTPAEMAELRHLAENGVSTPAQGVASTFEPLNVHTEPSRTSPSFVQIPEGGKVDVIGHRVTPRTQEPAPVPAPPARPRPSRRKKEKASNKIPPPPPGPAPKLPANWMELSKTPKKRQTEEEAKKDAPPPPPVHLDDWTLVRTKNGQVGWVLSRMITMAIPDEVAQYAEGHRITSYFQMGDVHDEDQLKHNWLWTTVGKGAHPYEFDSFRFFIWSKHHHRYETAYIERDVVGHYPVLTKVTPGEMPQFTLILEEDGKVVRRTYEFNGYRVHAVNTEPYEMPGQNAAKAPVQVSAFEPKADPGKQKQGWWQGLKGKFLGLFHR